MSSGRLYMTLGDCIGAWSASCTGRQCILSLTRYIASHPELVEKLSETWPIRRLAQLTAYSFFKAKELGEEGVQKGVEKIKDSEMLKQFEEMPPSEHKMSTFFHTFAKELRGGMSELSDKIEKDKKQLEDKEN
ncbi:uncharacterized protein LOC102810336 [Saccoglossus kowalevskii]|uniref:Uncharacterized protein LOC102810336 n=1 Tax=Saccoglossus kowalevskii TaxID=10224 RepID=A0ABM0MV11_SACKO|nr:PREDICTED: uncharacterized protein LOC102810336 [Saccoglossus kowalevskii]